MGLSTIRTGSRTGQRLRSSTQIQQGQLFAARPIPAVLPFHMLSYKHFHLIYKKRMPDVAHMSLAQRVDDLRAAFAQFAARTGTDTVVTQELGRPGRGLDVKAQVVEPPHEGFRFTIRPPFPGCRVYYTLNGATPYDFDREVPDYLEVVVPPGEQRVLKCVAVTPAGRRSMVVTTRLGNPGE